MRLIPPSEIGARIITLVMQSSNDLTIVSPYNKIESWPKMQDALRSARRRGVNVSFYLREGEYPKGFDHLDISPVPVPNLHAKIYMSEKQAIVTSMNLVRASDEKSLDIGYITTTASELRELRDYIRMYISREETPATPLPDGVQPHEPLFIDYYERVGCPQARALGAAFMAKRSHETHFVECCGYADHGVAVGTWLHFLPNGFLERMEFHRENESGLRRAEYGTNTSLYELILSVANIVGGLFEIDSSGLFFKSRVGMYTGENREKLLSHIEQCLEIKLHKRDHTLFEDLVEEMKWYLQGNEEPYPTEPEADIQLD